MFFQVTSRFCPSGVTGSRSWIRRSTSRRRSGSGKRFMCRRIASSARSRSVVDPSGKFWPGVSDSVSRRVVFRPSASRSYHGNSDVPTYPVVRKIVAGRPYRARIGAAWVSESRYPSSKVNASAFDGARPSRSRSASSSTGSTV